MARWGFYNNTHNVTTHIHYFPNVFSVDIISGHMYPGPTSVPYGYYVVITCDISIDGVSWTELGTITGWSGEDVVYSFPMWSSPGRCNQLRFRVTGGTPGGNIYMSVGVLQGMLYVRPKNVIPSIRQVENKIKLSWNYTEEGDPVQSVEVYKQTLDGGLLKIAVVSSDNMEYYDDVSIGQNKYVLRTVGPTGNYSEFVEIEYKAYFYDMIQLEFGAGGDIMRHDIKTHHNSNGSNNNIIVNLWGKEEEVYNTSNDTDLKLSGDEKIYTKDYIPINDNSFELGSEIGGWKNTMSKKTIAEISTSAKLKLWNGR